MYYSYPNPYMSYGYRSEMQNQSMMLPLEPYTYPQNLPGALKLITDAVAGEREDEMFYDYLISIAPNNEAVAIIETIRNDERRHNKMFRTIYYQLTGKMVPPTMGEEFEKPASYCDGIRKALLGELGAVQRYRRILFALQDRVQINMLIEIITDELRHASLYNLLFTSAKCFE